MVTDDDIKIVFKEPHPVKTDMPMLATLLCIVTVSNAQKAKAKSKIAVTFKGRVRRVKSQKPENARRPMVVTEGGRQTLDTVSGVTSNPTQVSYPFSMLD